MRVYPPVMRRRLRRLPVILLVFFGPAAAAAGEYRTVEIESLKITFDSTWGTRTAPGYVPVRFDITNVGDPRVIEIVGQGMRFFRSRRGGAPGGIDVRQAVRLARGDRVRLTVPVPVLAESENIRFEIREGGETLERFNYTGFQSKSTPADASALIVVADPAGPFGRAAASWPRPLTARAGMSFAGGSTAPVDFVLDPSRLPTNWLGYTSLRAVFVGPAEWEQLNEPQKSALLTWTACGGDLMFVDGELNTLFPSSQQPAGPDRAPRAYFFGRIHRPTSELIGASGLAAVLADAARVQDSNWALPANGARDWGLIVARGFRLPIPGVQGVPARAYLSILIVFSALVGPLNYWVLWRKRQQVLFVLTAPLISAVFILFLAVYVVAGEGFGVRARAVTFTMLDQVRMQASTRSSVSLYAAGMRPNGGLRFARDVAVFSLGPDGSGSQDRQTLDLTDGQRFQAGIIEARSPTNLEIIGFRTARERLSFAREAAGSVSVVNGLGAMITALLYRVDNTVYSLTGPLPPGGKASMKIGGIEPRNLVPPGLPLSSRLEYLIEHQPAGSYLAVLDRSPFWDPGVSSVSERASFHVVLGWPEGQR